MGWLEIDFFSLYSVVNKVDRDGLGLGLGLWLWLCFAIVLLFALGFSLLLSFGHGECFVILVMFEFLMSGLAKMIFF